MEALRTDLGRKYLSHRARGHSEVANMIDHHRASNSTNSTCKQSCYNKDRDHPLKPAQVKTPNAIYDIGTNKQPKNVKLP